MSPFISSPEPFAFLLIALVRHYLLVMSEMSENMSLENNRVNNLITYTCNSSKLGGGGVKVLTEILLLSKIINPYINELTRHKRNFG